LLQAGDRARLVVVVVVRGRLEVGQACEQGTALIEESVFVLFVPFGGDLKAWERLKWLGGL